MDAKHRVLLKNFWKKDAEGARELRLQLTDIFPGELFEVHPEGRTSSVWVWQPLSRPEHTPGEIQAYVEDFYTRWVSYSAALDDWWNAGRHLINGVNSREALFSHVAPIAVREFNAWFSRRPVLFQGTPKTL